MFWRPHFQKHFPEWNTYIYWNFTAISSCWSNKQAVGIGLGNNLAPNKRQTVALTSTNTDPSAWRHMASLVHNNWADHKQPLIVAVIKDWQKNKCKLNWAHGFCAVKIITHHGSPLRSPMASRHLLLTYNPRKPCGAATTTTSPAVQHAWVWVEIPSSHLLHTAAHGPGGGRAATEAPCMASRQQVASPQ